MSITHPLLATRFVRVETILKTIASKRSTIVSLGDAPSQLTELQCAHSVLQSIDLSLALDSDKQKYKEYIHALECEAELFEAIVARLVEVEIKAMNLTGLIARADADQLGNTPPLNPYILQVPMSSRVSMSNATGTHSSVEEYLSMTPEQSKADLNKALVENAKARIGNTKEAISKADTICIKAVDSCIDLRNKGDITRDVTVVILKSDLGVERITRNLIDNIADVMLAHGLRDVQYDNAIQRFSGSVNIEHAVIHPGNISFTSKYK